MLLSIIADKFYFTMESIICGMLVLARDKKMLVELFRHSEFSILP